MVIRRFLAGIFAFVVVLATFNCSNGGLPCCAFTGDAGATVCICGTAPYGGASCSVNASAGACTLDCVQNGTTTPISGTPRSSC